MKTATVTESKNGLSELLRSAKAGKGVLILDRDVPVARLEPVAADTLPDDVRLQALERQGLIRRQQEAGSVWEKLKALPAPRVKAGRSAVAALLAEREEGR
ncbi:MAG: type II toxin-antitoxin system prevent-host-death family antitoxin [Verrucomicrobia bacterium]|nr:type II toxin-antitoxin system prevent-host-death family antitoxin [Verrucomicrobiota bacterium]